MTLTAGTKLGPYEIVGAIGAGGMGEVYRAKDTRLEREVAIKILTAELAKDPDLRARFDREAKAISALNHPNICTLHDVGHDGGTDYLVMELLEGESLAERLHRGPMQVQQLLAYGQQIADALEKAHRSGIVHRDLKPGNIVITKTGAKLLDFGLAKPRAAAASAMTGALTRTTPISPITQQGTVVGTFQYMSPEQIEGAEADARSDIFALGAVLYEMATGKRAFEGKSQLSVASAILEKDPEPISKIQPLTPPALEHVVQTCLAKDPENRFQTAHDVKLQLKWIAEGGSSAVGVPAIKSAHRKQREWLAWAIAGVLFAGLVLATTGYVLRAPKPRQRMYASITAPTDTSFQPFDFALSPDGSKMAFVAGGTRTKPQLWVRPLDSPTGQPLADTEGASFPFWSPDGRQIAFFAGGQLKRIDAAGGGVQVMADAPNGRGGAWGPDGTILFTPTPDDPLYRVSAGGGTPTVVTALDPSKNEITHRWPWFLPDGRHFLYLIRTGGSGPAKNTGESSNGIYISSLDSPGEKQLLVHSDRRAMYAPGALVFLRGVNLMAQKVDWKRSRTIGDSVLIAEQVAVDDRYTGAYSVSNDGKMVFQGGGTIGYALSWHDRDGKSGEVVANGLFNVTRLSPDGKKVAASVSDLAAGTLDIWIFDLARGVKTRFTFDPADDDDPVWSPDGSTIVFDSARKGYYNLYRKPANGSQQEELLYEDAATKYPTSWSSDGKYILFDRTDHQGKTKGDVWVLPMVGDHKAFPLLQTEFNERLGEFSPDGKWVAYVSNESGREEIYAVSFPKPGGRFQISSGGGSNPKWRADGKELYYLDTSNKLVAVPISAHADTLEIGAPQTLFQTRIWSTGYFLSSASDGKRFLLVENPEINASHVSLILNWDTALEK